MDVLLVFLAGLLGYVYLRSHGGKGLDIEAKAPKPISTKAGKLDRLVADIVLALMAAAIVYVFLHQSSVDRWTVVVIPFIVGALIFLIPHLSKKKH